MSVPALRCKRSLIKLAATSLSLLIASGCSRQGPETIYGSALGTSLNGTRTFADLLRARGHTVRPAWSLTEPLADWANVLVRFATRPGSIDSDEAAWYSNWLGGEPGRSLIYVVRDYDAEPEYWDQVLEQLSSPADSERRIEAQSRRDRAKNWLARLPARTSQPADPDEWFALGPPLVPPLTCKTLDSPWAVGVDSRQAALPLHEPLKADREQVLLRGDGHVLAMDWETDSNSRILVITSGAFLLNLPLVNPARRALAAQAAAWVGNRSRQVAFVTGPSVLGNPDEDRTLLDLAWEDDRLFWIAIQFVVFGLLACLARAPRLGRPRPDPPSDADHPAAHAQALGALLERSRGTDTARHVLAAYRRWRFPRPPGALRRPPGPP